MAREITWRNVDAPDFSTALKGVETANKLFNQAIDSGQSLVNGVQGMQTDAANRAIQQRINGITDPLALQQAVQDGSLVGPDAQHASQQLLASLPGVVDTRVKTAEGLNTYGRTLDRQKAMDAFKPFLANMNIAMMGGDINKVKEIMATPEFQALDPETQNSLLRGGFNNDTSAFNSMKGRKEFADSQQQIADQKMLQGHAARVAELTTGTAKIDYINALPIEDRYKAQLRQSAGITNSLSAAAGDLPQINPTGYDPAVNVGTMSGGQQMKAGVATFGDYTDDKNVDMFRRKADKSLESTAFGSFQINRDTMKDFGPKVFGDSWKNVRLDDYPAQYKLGEAIFNDASGNGDKLAGRWAALKDMPKEDRDALAKMSWQQAAPIISGYEHGASQDPVFRTQSAVDLLNVRINQISAENTGAASYFTDLADNRDEQAVVTDAIKNKEIDVVEGDPNEGEVRDRLKEMITLAREKTGVPITPSMAMKYLLKTQGETSWYLADAETGSTTAINEDAFLAEVKKSASGATLAQAEQIRTLQQSQQSLTKNATELAAAKQRYMTYQKMKEEGRLSKQDEVSLKLAKGAYDAYSKQATDLMRQLDNSPFTKPKFSNTEDETKVPGNTASSGSRQGQPTNTGSGVKIPSKPKELPVGASPEQRAQLRLEQEAYRAALEQDRIARVGK